jgi:hypothetical protein
LNGEAILDQEESLDLGVRVMSILYRGKGLEKGHCAGGCAVDNDSSSSVRLSWSSIVVMGVVCLERVALVDNLGVNPKDTSNGL